MRKGAKSPSRALPSASAVTPIRDVPDLYVFRFELGPAILKQLLEKLNPIPIAPIHEQLDAKYPGFYQLFHKGEPKYIGKTSRPVGERLREHRRKLWGRIGIDWSAVSVRYAFVEDPSLVDIAEGALISYFASNGMAEWNLSGFGSKVTGSGRADQKRSNWGKQHPPNFGVRITAGSPEPLTLYEFLRQIASWSPVSVSVPATHQKRFKLDHPGEHSIPQREDPFDVWVTRLEGLLAKGWKVDRRDETWYVQPR